MKFFLGIDVGGTSIKIALVDQDGRVVACGSCLTQPERDCPSAVDRLDRVAREISQGRAWEAVGVGCAGPIDVVSGIVANPYTLPGWEGANLGRLLTSRLGGPVYLENDANTAHLGEVMSRANRPANSIMLTFGTGVGVSVRMNGDFFRAANAAHPELGHGRVSVAADSCCYCGVSNCLENILSGVAINRAAAESAGTTPEELLDRGAEQVRSVLLHRWRTALLDAVSNLALTFHPDVVFVSGGMQDFVVRHLVPSVQEKLTQLLPLYGGAVLEESRAGYESGAVGAAWLAIQNIRR